MVVILILGGTGFAAAVWIEKTAIRDAIRS
jgi:hypothetical protein